MNYHVHYDRLITRARCRVLTGYRERHHVVPVCRGGTAAPTNLVELTPEEHYVAHLLLVYMYPDDVKLAYAAYLMATRSNKAFGWIRRRHANVRRGVPQTESTRAKISAAMCGRPQSIATRQKRATSLLGNRNAVGGVWSVESRARVAAFMKGNSYWNGSRKCA